MMQMLPRVNERIRSCKLKLARVHVDGQFVEPNLHLRVWVKHELVQESVLRSLKALPIAWGHSGRLTAQLLDHLSREEDNGMATCVNETL